ncbi:MAG: hypothetical protein U9O94_10525 [Nanoarchaeota archaeon]|nr:hypothetical protein [Nanoarchaeota archaeon]
MSGKKEKIGSILLCFAEQYGITYSGFNPVPESLFIGKQHRCT